VDAYTTHPYSYTSILRVITDHLLRYPSRPLYGARCCLLLKYCEVITHLEVSVSLGSVSLIYSGVAADLETGYRTH